MINIVREFEERMAEALGVKECIAVNSGTSALIASLWSLDLKPGDEVITTPFTFPATVNAIIIAGGTPIFVDVREENSLIDERLIEAAITPRTRAILPVHLFGRACNLTKIFRIAQDNRIILIEDACQALFKVIPPPNYFNSLPNNLCGTIGDAGCFSFYRTKNLPTFEGGMISIPRHSKLNANRIRGITDQGGKPDYTEVGFNFRMADPLALIGLQYLEFHRNSIEDELGSYKEINGYYPYVVYRLPSLQKRGIGGNCQVAESIAREIKEKLC